MKWPEAHASPTKEAINVAEFLNDLILRHGSPDVAISDQGTEFCNQVCPYVHYQTNVTRCHHPYMVRGGRVVWTRGSEGLHEMRILRGWEGEGCLVVWVRGIT